MRANIHIIGMAFFKRIASRSIAILALGYFIRKIIQLADVIRASLSFAIRFVAVSQHIAAHVKIRISVINGYIQGAQSVYALGRSVNLSFIRVYNNAAVFLNFSSNAPITLIAGIIAFGFIGEGSAGVIPNPVCAVAGTDVYIISFAFLKGLGRIILIKRAALNIVFKSASVHSSRRSIAR